ncbi:MULTISPECIES: energy transducer TonB [unclassified Pseudomonas]|uniref:energy transducer TonB n=1 Tax=unclassified Pseudomonas TaxID=196821 RepID=UPI0005D3194A|nr:energy transducer TonB [Pseudomonas sp. ES3-33]KJH75809.1 energy transducer TonB [Pseudomonas sp. ES3-33]
MTAMTLHRPYLAAAPVDRSGLWRNGLAASFAVGLHVIVLGLLVRGWVAEMAPAEQPAVLRTQLVILAPTPEAPALQAPIPSPIPAPEPLPAVVQPPEPVAATPAPSKPAVDPQVQVQKLQQVALARKRVEEKKRELQAEQNRERLESQNRAREVEQQRLAQQQSQQAEQARLSAERSRQQAAAQAAADTRQYLPLSKQAPDYPQRALDKNLEGDCTVEYTVNPQGKIENPKVLEGCHPMFMRPSLAAADTFRYQPRMIDGKAVSVPAVRNTFHYRIK